MLGLSWKDGILKLSDFILWDLLVEVHYTEEILRSPFSCAGAYDWRRLVHMLFGAKNAEA